MWLLDELKLRKDEKDHLAIVHRDESLSFAELWDKSEKIACWMKESLHSKAPVLIYGNKDSDIVPIMVGSLKSGRAYVPIDVTFPKDRVQTIAGITDAEVLFDLSGASISGINTQFVINKSMLNGIEKSHAVQSVSEEDWVSDEDNCYILFTSGSTGEPKGVQITKSNILNFVDWFGPEASVEGEVVLNQVSYSFDVSVIQLYIYLANGKTLFSIDKEMISNFGELFEFLRKSGISSWVSTPSFIEMCAVYESFEEALLPGLKSIILAGEVLTKKLVKALWEKFPGVKVINGYGPTEGTVLLTSCVITPEMVDDEANELPIGYILDGAEYEIDTKVLGNEADSAVLDKGELIVTSRSISNGYFKNPQATSKSFFKRESEQFMSYRTGDIVYESNGLLYYCGRKDYQIKLNGYRIELDDISENINKIDEVSNNVVIPVYKDGRVSYIAAFIVLKRDLGLSTVKTSVFLRKRLGEYVPSYMIPKKIVILEQFPLNVNGKIDRKYLTEKYL